MFHCVSVLYSCALSHHLQIKHSFLQLNILSDTQARDSSGSSLSPFSFKLWSIPAWYTSRFGYIFIWGTMENVEILKDCPHWSANGTFSACPKVSGQFYTVHCSKFPALPLLFAVLPNMKQETYERLFRNIQNIIGTNPKTFMIDFEAAARNAIQNVFPGIVVNGCNFHFKQAINRNIKKKNGRKN